MSDKAIKVTQTADGAYAVVVRDGGSETRHEVTGGSAAEVETAFRFLLEREPKEAILARFDLSVIPRYFPEFQRELPRYIKGGA